MLPAIILGVVLALSVTQCAPDTGGTLVILVRHAEKSYVGPDPGLTPEGTERARALAETLEYTQIDRIITSDRQRCQLTASFVARAQGIKPIVIGRKKGLGPHIQTMTEEVRSSPPGVILVVGHRNTIPPIIAALGGPEFPEMGESEHATMFILEIPARGDVRFVRARYGPPDPLD